jgi:DNA-binding Lrp family transcriptional regulator
VQARLDRLESTGVITGWSPTLDPAGLGFPVSAFATLEIAQAGGHQPVAKHLHAIPEVLEAHTITGAADLMVRLVAQSNADLQRVIDEVVSSPHVVRASTVIVLATEIPHRVTPLLR